MDSVALVELVMAVDNEGKHIVVAVEVVTEVEATCRDPGIFEAEVALEVLLDSEVDLDFQEELITLGWTVAVVVILVALASVLVVIEEVVEGDEADTDEERILDNEIPRMIKLKKYNCQM